MKTKTPETDTRRAEFKAARLAAGLSQAHAAELLSVTRGAVRQWESGIRSIGGEVMTAARMLFKENSETRRMAGRPESLKLGRYVTTYLDADSVASAARIGDGNVSLGIRLALAAYAIRQTVVTQAECHHVHAPLAPEHGEP